MCWVQQSMRVKLQPASSSRLPAFSPLLPPAVVSQTLLLDNPHKVCAGAPPQEAAGSVGRAGRRPRSEGPSRVGRAGGLSP